MLARKLVHVLRWILDLVVSADAGRVHLGLDTLILIADVVQRSQLFLPHSQYLWIGLLVLVGGGGVGLIDAALRFCEIRALLRQPVGHV